LLYETELDDFSELQTQIGDKTLINEEDEITFDIFPITPSAAPDANYEVANKKYVDDNAGVDKTNWVYPQDYATGTGTEGDPWAGDCINDAITACPAGGTVYLRKGYYETSRILPNKSINIIGEGIQKTFIVTTETTLNAMYFEEDDYVTLQGFTLDCSTITADQAAGINIHNCDYTVLRDLEVHDTGKEAINFYECNYGLLENLWLHDDHEHGIHPGSDTPGTNIHNTYRNIYCYDNTLMGFYDRGDISNPGEPCYNVYDNIQAWGNGNDGISITYQKGAHISNCYSEDNGSNGFDFAGLEDSSIVNCIAKYNGYTNDQAGLLIGDGVNVNITNVIVLNNNTGFDIDSCDGIRLTSCQSYDDREVTGTDIAFVDGGEGADTITMTAAKFLYAGFEAGETITVTGAGEAGNNDDFTIVSVVAGTITLATGKLTGEVAGETVTITQYKQVWGAKFNVSNTNISFTNCTFSPNVNGDFLGDATALSSLDVYDGLNSAEGDIAYNNGTNWVRLAKGTAQYVFGMGDSNIPEWDAVTGTGSVVRATSPTLVTPALGTPSALVGTNISGTASSLTAGTASVATAVTITDNEDTAENNPLVFVAGGDLDGGNLGLESDGTSYYTPSTGKITATGFIGALTGNADTVTGFTPASGSLTLAGADAVTLTTTNTTGVTLPTSGTLMANVSEDSTPQLGGNLDSTDKNITGIGRASFTQELDNGSKDANFSIDFDTDNKQKVTLTENEMTLTLDTTTVGVGNYLLKMVNGGLATLTWASESGSVYFPGGTDPSLTASGTDIVTFYFDGTNWYGVGSLDFK